MYVTIAVKPETKKLIDQRKEEFGLNTYDETIQRLVRPDLVTALEAHTGALKGTPKFERDRRDRKFA